MTATQERPTYFAHLQDKHVQRLEAKNQREAVRELIALFCMASIVGYALWLVLTGRVAS